MKDNIEMTTTQDAYLKNSRETQFYKDLTKFTTSGYFDIITKESYDTVDDIAWRIADLYATFVQSDLRDKDYGGCEDDPEFILMKFVINYVMTNNVSRHNFIEAVSDASVLFDCEIYKYSHWIDSFEHYGEYFGYDEHGKILWFYSNEEDGKELEGLTQNIPYYLQMPLYRNFGDAYVETILAHIVCEPVWKNILHTSLNN